MKTLNGRRDARDVAAHDVKPGMVLLEGVVLRVERIAFGQRVNATTPFGIVYIEPDETVQVFAQFDADSIDAITHAFAGA